MRSKAVFLVLIFLASLFAGFVQGQTPEDITVDGDYSDWSADALMATDGNGIDFRLTWNSTHLFVGWDGTDWKSTDEGADLFVYLNTSEGGSVLARDWGFAHTLPFAADHGFVLEDDTYFQHVAYDGSAWTDQPTEVELYAGWSGNQATELSLPWTALGHPQGSTSWCTPSGRMAGTFGPLSPCKTLRATTERKLSRTPGTLKTSATLPRRNNSPSSSPEALRRWTMH